MSPPLPVFFPGQFLECLFVHYDFDGAQQKLQECDAVIDNDYFLTAIKADFLESARLFMFETYCRIHQVRGVMTLTLKQRRDNGPGGGVSGTC